MNEKLFLALVVGAGLGAVGTSEATQSAAAWAFGAYPSHVTEESYYLSVGATAGGNDARERLREEVRNTVVVPGHYGSVVAVTPAPGGAIVWYRNASGVVRNVVLQQPEDVLFRLEPRAVDRLEVKVR